MPCEDNLTATSVPSADGRVVSLEWVVYPKSQHADLKTVFAFDSLPKSAFRSIFRCLTRSGTHFRSGADKPIIRPIHHVPQGLSFGGYPSCMKATLKYLPGKRKSMICLTALRGETSRITYPMFEDIGNESGTRRVRLTVADANGINPPGPPDTAKAAQLPSPFEGRHMNACGAFLGSETHVVRDGSAPVPLRSWGALDRSDSQK